MIRLGIAGITGRMGSSINNLVKKDNSFKIVAATTSIKNKAAGTTDESGITISSDPKVLFECSDVVIDFTSPDAAMQHLELAKQSKTPIVIGTTGLKEEHFLLVEKASNDIPVLYASNTSVGITLLHNIVTQITQALGGQADIEINERHHRNKIDAPSGTAISLGKTIAKCMGATLDDVACYNYNERNSARKTGSIGFSSSRGGLVIGDHTVSFITDDEIIDISHKALTRDVFAKGALKAAAWLIRQEHGLYNMGHVLGLSN